ncbi:MAG: dihydrofolate reductase family protein [Micropruina sp.]
MGKLTYTMITSLDGYVSGPDGRFDWAMPDEETHRFINERERAVGTYLYGRRMFEMMSYWASPEALDGVDYTEEYAHIWRAADKVVYSSTLEEPTIERTRLVRAVDPDAVRALKESSEGELCVAGPMLAAAMLRAGLVDELGVYVVPAVVGGGTRMLPDALTLDLALIEEQRFSSGFVLLRYAIRGASA